MISAAEPTQIPRTDAAEKYFLPYQVNWLRDTSRLRIVEKSRQIGFSYVDSYDSVVKAAVKGGLDVWVVSRDETQAKEYIKYCQRWSQVLKHAALDHGEKVFSDANGKEFKVQVITFASGASIYALSSNPDAIVGKTGHVKLDEFALHKDQRQLYRVAKPVTQWGGTLSIISTHRGVATVFNEIIRDIKERGNPMGWCLHTVPIQAAVEMGLVEKINKATGNHESRQAWLKRQRAECLDEEQWQQEYCCIPADDAAAFISYEMISACEGDNLLTDFEGLKKISNQLYLGMDVARRGHLTVIGVGEMAGGVMIDRYRLELRNKSFSEQRAELYRLLELPNLRRGCLDATGLGMQMAEEAQARFGYKVEPVTFTAPVKEALAFPLRSAFEDRNVRIARDPNLRADLRGIKKETTAAGNIRFAGEAADSHCDRFWELALRWMAAAKPGVGFSAITI